MAEAGQQARQSLPGRPPALADAVPEVPPPLPLARNRAASITRPEVSSVNCLRDGQYGYEPSPFPSNTARQAPRQILIANEERQTGPFSEDQVRSMLRSGFLAPGDLCWHEGLSSWLPISHVIGSVTIPSPPTAWTSFHRDATSAYGQQYAGFWLRFAAFFVDGIILQVIQFPVCFVVGFLWAASRKLIATNVMPAYADPHAVGILVWIAVIITYWLYFALMEMFV